MRKCFWEGGFLRPKRTPPASIREGNAVPGCPLPGALDSGGRGGDSSEPGCVRLLPVGARIVPQCSRTSSPRLSFSVHFPSSRVGAQSLRTQGTVLRMLSGCEAQALQSRPLSLLNPPKLVTVKLFAPAALKSSGNPPHLVLAPRRLPCPFPKATLVLRWFCPSEPTTALRACPYLPVPPLLALCRVSLGGPGHLSSLGQQSRTCQGCSQIMGFLGLIIRVAWGGRIPSSAQITV